MPAPMESFGLEASERWIIAGERNIAHFIRNALVPPHILLSKEERTVILRHGADAIEEEDDRIFLATPFVPPAMELVFPARMESFDFDEDGWPYEREGMSCRFCICDGAPYLERSIRELAEAAREDFRHWPVFMIFGNLHRKIAFSDDPTNDPLTDAMEKMKAQDIPFITIESRASVRSMFYRHPAGTQHFFGFSYGRCQIRERLVRMENWTESQADRVFGTLQDTWNKEPMNCACKTVLDSITSYRTVSKRTETHLWRRYVEAGWTHLTAENGLQLLVECFEGQIPLFVPDYQRVAWEDRFTKKLRSAYLVAVREPRRYDAAWDALAIGSDMEYIKMIQGTNSALYGVTGEFRKRYQTFLEERCLALLKEQLHEVHDEIQEWERRSRI